jgi:ankyrin repeat protein
MKLLWLFLTAASTLLAEEAGLFDAIRQGNHSGVSGLLANGANVNAARADGVTPLMQAVLTSDVRMVKLLIAKGADVKARNTPIHVTALHAAVFNPEMTKLLLDAGAEPDAATSSGQTPMFGAVVRGGASPVLRMLMDKGANVNAIRTAGAKRPPLTIAVASADPAALKLMFDRGADASLAMPLNRMAMQGVCSDCMRLLLAKSAKPMTVNLADAAAAGSFEVVKQLVESGVPVNGKDARGYTPLMRAVLSYSQSRREIVAYLLAKGADTSPKNELGDTALSIARRFGNDTPIVALLKAASAPDAGTSIALPPPVAGNTVSAAIARGIPLLQKIGAPLFKLRGCVSCHNNTQPAMVVAMAQRRGFAVDEEVAQRELKAMTAGNRGQRDQLMMGTGIPEIDAYVLLALHEARQPASAVTDASVHQIAFRQEPGGHWRVDDYRPPQEYSDISGTALAARALQLYAPPGRAVEMKERLARARTWLLAAPAEGTEELSMRLLGLGWMKAPGRAIAEATAKLIAEQRPDGGWPQLPGMDPDAYATGLALYALHLGGGVPVSHAAYRRGVRHLLDTQRPDGSWFVQTRSYPFQPYFESGFPYGHSQWISAAGSSWAMLSLLLTVPEQSGSR